MFLFKKILAIGIFVFAISYNLFGNMLEYYNQAVSSHIYLCEQNLFFKGTGDRLICAYKEGNDVSIPFTDISIHELEELFRNNVNLVYYSPELDVEGNTDSEKNIKAQRQLGYFAECKMCAWVDVLGANLYPVTTNDARIINDPLTEKAWCDSIKNLSAEENKKMFSLARVWDLRLDLLLEKRVISWGNFFCDSSGVKVADNPIFGIWSFESNWLDRMLAGDWRELPEFFTEELNREWNNWVYNEVVKTTDEFKEKYKFLVKGESVEEGTLKLVAEEQHPTIKENEKWITLGDDTRTIYEKTSRASLQREFFIQLYLNHISRLKSKFSELGKVTRDAPYFITMSTKDNANMQLTDLYFGSQNAPYVCRYLGFTEKQESDTFSCAKEYFEQNSLLKNASIIMVPHSVFKNVTPFTLGFIQYARTPHPQVVSNFGITESDITFIEQTATFKFGSSETNIVDEIEFQIHDFTPTCEVTNIVNGVEVVSEVKPTNDDFVMTLKYVKINRDLGKKKISFKYVFLEYDTKSADHVQLHILGKSLANNRLLGNVKNNDSSFRKHKFDKRGAMKLPLNRGYSLLFITKDSKEISPLDF